MSTLKFFFSLVMLCSFLLCSCVSPAAKRATVHSHDSIFTLVCDSFQYFGHSYIFVRDLDGAYHSTAPCVLHSPDCICRYNRTFIVIKRSK